MQKKIAPRHKKPAGKTKVNWVNVQAFLFFVTTVANDRKGSKTYSKKRGAKAESAVLECRDVRLNTPYLFIDGTRTLPSTT